MLSVANLFSQSAFFNRRVVRYACLTGLLLILTAESPKAQLFGTGADGIVVISSNTSLTSDMNAFNLVINPGAILNTQGYTIYVSNLLQNFGTITDNSSGGNGGGGGQWGAGGKNANPHITPTNGGGGQGGFGPSKSGAGFGGKGGGGGGGGGGAWDAVFGAWAGGGSGHFGGKGGRGGGLIEIFAKQFQNSSAIDVNGKNGLDGGNGGQGGFITYTEVFFGRDLAGGGGGGGGGGYGGNGGTISVTFGYLLATGSLTRTGGSGGSGGIGGNGRNTSDGAAAGSSEENGRAGGSPNGGSGGRSEESSASSQSGQGGGNGGSGSTGTINMTVATLCYADNDGDGYGDASDPGTWVTGSCAVTNNLDCDDGNGSVYPGATEIVGDGVDQNCDGFDACYVDADVDGYGSNSVITGVDLTCSATGESSNNLDCDDTNAARNPGNSETTCNGIDDDCNAGTPDEIDADGDGATACTDCDDSDPNVFPGNIEVCDNIDNDCNGTIDDNAVDAQTYYFDADGDGYGDFNNSIQSCPNVPPGYIADGTDCDDTDNTIYPGAVEVLDDGIDQDCNGSDLVCCGLYTTGQTGNTDCDILGKRNLSDITRLIDNVYISKDPLCCSANGNVDGDFEGKKNLADITKLIDHVYISKDETAPCE